ncbi:MAG: oxidoreductase [Gammaproteobacteria bacterium]|nr:oxidoreductase [Gammaproteobacteria bacterium]
MGILLGFHRVRAIAVALVVLVSFCTASQAADLDQPTGDILLTIFGEIGNSNSTQRLDGKELRAAVFDLAMLETLPSVSISTHTPWTEGVTEFTGVRMDVLMQHVDADYSDITMSALDDYTVDMTELEFADYPIVLAYKVNGNYLSVRELGPLWVMYPFDDYPELDTSINKARCVWQLTSILVR